MSIRTPRSLFVFAFALLLSVLVVLFVDVRLVSGSVKGNVVAVNAMRWWFVAMWLEAEVTSGETSVIESDDWGEGWCCCWCCRMRFCRSVEERSEDVRKCRRALRLSTC